MLKRPPRHATAPALRRALSKLLRGRSRASMRESLTTHSPLVRARALTAEAAARRPRGEEWQGRPEAEVHVALAQALPRRAAGTFAATSSAIQAALSQSFNSTKDSLGRPAGVEVARSWRGEDARPPTVLDIGSDGLGAGYYGALDALRFHDCEDPAAVSIEGRASWRDASEALHQAFVNTDDGSAKHIRTWEVDEITDMDGSDSAADDGAGVAPADGAAPPPTTPTLPRAWVASEGDLPFGRFDLTVMSYMFTADRNPPEVAGHRPPHMHLGDPHLGTDSDEGTGDEDAGEWSDAQVDGEDRAQAGHQDPAEVVEEHESWLARVADRTISAWRRTQGLLVIVDAGTPVGFRAVAEARRAVLATGEGYVVAPCTHSLRCPLLAPDRDPPAGEHPAPATWCHFAQQLQMSPTHRAVEGRLNQDSCTEKFSYVVLARGRDPADAGVGAGDAASRGAALSAEDAEVLRILDEADEAGGGPGGDSDADGVWTVDEEPLAPSEHLPNAWLPGRLIQAPLKRGGHITVDACLASGHTVRRTYGKRYLRGSGGRGGVSWSDMRKSRWGDAMVIPPRKPRTSRAQRRGLLRRERAEQRLVAADSIE